jgi:hypothetical protein
MKYLNVEEVALLNEMKDRCLNGGEYIDENAQKKFEMLCHLEDFAIQYYNLLEVIKDTKKCLKQERKNHFNNIKLCHTRLEGLIISSVLCTCDRGLDILSRGDTDGMDN